MKRLFILTLIFAITISFVPLTLAESEKTLKLATDERGEFFWVIGKNMAGVLSDEGIPTDVVVTHGDIDNIEMLVSKEADLAVVSGPVINKYLNEVGAQDDIVIVTPIWPSAVHFMIRHDYMESGSITDLYKKTVYLGEEKSWEREAATKILEALGVKTKKMMSEVTEIELIGVMTDFVGKRLDGAVIIGAVPDPMVDSILSKTGHIYKLIPIGEGELKLISGTQIKSFLINLPSDTYSYQSEEFSTLAVPNFLISRRELSDDTAYRIVREIYKNAETIMGYQRRGGSLPEEDYRDHLIVPLHSGSEVYFEESGM